jgi:ABC-type nitrate/sulfonate/bicarbonate transport system substrate-binding protein
MNPNYDMEAAFNAMLQKEGLATESAGGTVKISMAAPAFTLNDLNAQQYAASFARSGYKKALLASGYHELGNTDTVFGGRIPATVLVVRKDILEKHPDIVQMVVQANYDATVKGKTDKEWQTEETALVTAFRLEYDGAADRMRTPEASQLDAQASPEYFQGAYDYMKSYGFLKVPYPLSALVDDSFYQKVKK